MYRNFIISYSQEILATFTLKVQKMYATFRKIFLFQNNPSRFYKKSNWESSIL